MNSLLPFYGLSIDTLRERFRETEKIEETFTLVIHDGKVELQWNDNYSRDTWWASRPRADAQINLMEPFLNQIGTLKCVPGQIRGRLVRADKQRDLHYSRSTLHSTRSRQESGASGRGKGEKRWDQPARHEG